MNLAIPFLTIEITKGTEKMTANIPKTLIEETVDFARSCGKNWEMNEKYIPSDSIVKILKDAEISKKPVMKIKNEGESVCFWIKDSRDIVKKTGIPKRLIINIQSDREENNMNLCLPLTMVKILPFLIPGIEEDAPTAKETRLFLRKALKEIQKVGGSFTIVETDEKDEDLKIYVE